VTETGQALRDAVAVEVMGITADGTWIDKRGYISDWLPDTDPRCYMAVVDRMTALGFEVEIMCLATACQVRLWSTRSGVVVARAESPDIGIAICHAALAAVRGSK